MVFPADKDVNVPLDTEISVTFDTEITTNDLLGITIMPDAGKLAVHVENQTLIIFHNGLKPYTTYTVYIPYGVVNHYDHFGFSWSFTSGNYTNLSIINGDE